ncbi:protein kinase [Pseudoalteromonas sp. RB2-MNA-CIBAN-0110]|uniref:protein kinase domain-containing protein n=1 Tax=Pseudoalteromonas sp. RB2-MNA-CIBAN-0110 TaxID=3140439 RepID=UPI00332BD75A
MSKRRKIKIGTIFNGCELLELLGKGGNGEVWKVVNHEQEAFYAIKFLINIDVVNYKRFQNEVSILSKLKIDGVMHVIDSYLPDDPKSEFPWFMMPVAQDFSKYCENLTPIEVASEFIKLAITLKELHSQKIAHRDIKPANMLIYNNRPYFTDFGLVQYPGKEDITPERRDIGAKYTMAPEMRRQADRSDGLPADVYSLAKSLWILITDQHKGFDGQYNPNSVIGISQYCPDIYTTELDNLLIECTDNDPKRRPSILSFLNRLSKWISLNKDFEQRNLLEWLELQNRIFPLGTPKSITWTDKNAIISILNQIAFTKSLNHMFYPNGGGNTINRITTPSEPSMIALHSGSGTRADIMKPKKLTFESFGFDPQWNYFRLELEKIKPINIDNSIHSEGICQSLCEIEDGEYVDYSCWTYNDYEGQELPETARPVERFLSGSFVFFGTSSIYNSISATYDARHNMMTEEEFCRYIGEAAKRFFNKSND